MGFYSENETLPILALLEEWDRVHGGGDVGNKNDLS